MKKYNSSWLNIYFILVCARWWRSMEIENEQRCVFVKVGIGSRSQLVQRESITRERNKTAVFKRTTICLFGCHQRPNECHTTQSQPGEALQGFFCTDLVLIVPLEVSSGCILSPILAHGITASFNKHVWIAQRPWQFKRTNSSLTVTFTAV